MRAYYGKSDQVCVTIEEAATVLRVNKHTLYRAVQAGEIPVIRIGRYVKIPVTFLLLEPPTPPKILTGENESQLEFSYDVPLHRVRLYRNGEKHRAWDYERLMYG